MPGRKGIPVCCQWGMVAVSGFELVLYLARYINFTLPFFMFLLGVLGIGAAIKKKNVFYISSGVTLTLAFVFHYYAAHIQINTHIVSMSVYASWIGIMLYEIFVHGQKIGKGFLTKVLIPFWYWVGFLRFSFTRIQFVEGLSVRKSRS